MPRAAGVCTTPGCPTITTPGHPRCHHHTRQHDQARGTRQARGYDRAHERLRTQWQARVATGTVECWRCGHPINPGTPWDLGHNDQDRTKYQGPEHAACNRGHRPTPNPTKGRGVPLTDKQHEDRGGGL